jgi:lactam utilization protein B
MAQDVALAKDHGVAVGLHNGYGTSSVSGGGR